MVIIDQPTKVTVPSIRPTRSTRLPPSDPDSFDTRELLESLEEQYTLVRNLEKALTVEKESQSQREMAVKQDMMLDILCLRKQLDKVTEELKRVRNHCTFAEKSSKKMLDKKQEECCDPSSVGGRDISPDTDNSLNQGLQNLAELEQVGKHGLHGRQSQLES